MSDARKYWFHFVISLVVTAFSQYQFQHCYRRDMMASSVQQELQIVQKHAAHFGDDTVFAFPDSPPGYTATASASPGTVGHSCPMCSHKMGTDTNILVSPALGSHSEPLHTHERHTCHACTHDHADGCASETSSHACDHDHAAEPGHSHAHHHALDQAPPDPTVSTGLVLMLRQLGFAELAANLLWIQMDADSHRGLWHRVEFALELIPVLDPTFIDAFLLRAFMLDEYQSRHDEAVQILESAVKQNPNRLELWQQLGLQHLNHT
ncbi:MAG TPA: hypothetical protein PKO06_16625, partial [Candidatus Ozemobacteraceae bacterium]|nr:hypothetical protein [Candidatus Ozemobacteraceae bacterium]